MTTSVALVAGRYRLVRLLGEGGMGRVWLARDELLDRQVAVKELSVASDSFDSWPRAIREAQAAARLTHPNLVRVYDVLYAGGRPWIVMEFIAARTLESIVDEGGPLTPARAASVALAVLEGLTAAHRAGVLHRDVKPHNVLIADDGRILLGDFGVAAFNDAGEITQERTLLGSPLYVAPERLQHGRSTVHTDLWSFGAMLYRIVEGRAPYQRASAAAQLEAIRHEPPDPLRLAGPLTPIITGLLVADPAQRLTATVVRHVLSEVVQEGAGTMPVLDESPTEVIIAALPQPRAGDATVAIQPPTVAVPRPTAMQRPTVAVTRPTVDMQRPTVAIPRQRSPEPAVPGPAESPVAAGPPARARSVVTEPVKPTGVEPGFVEREPVEAGPVAAAAAEPVPVEPAPLAPEPVDAEPVAAVAADPAPIAVTPVAPTPVAVEPVAPMSVGAEPIATNPVQAGPVEGGPVDTAPTGDRPFEESAGEAEAGPSPSAPPVSVPAKRVPRPRMRRTILAGTAAAVVVAAAAAGAVTFGSHHGGAPAEPTAMRAAPPAVSPARARLACDVAGTNPGIAPSTVASAGGPSPLPNGLFWQREPAKFRVGVPAAWTRATAGPEVCFYAPDGRRRLTVQPGAPLDPDRVSAWQRAEQQLLAAGAPPAYKRVNIGPAIYRKGGADWEYTYAVDGTTWHVLRRSFALDATRAYILTWTAPDQDWNATLPLLTAITTSFDSGT